MMFFRVTPVPIPNTTVKPLEADGTARETVWESRWSPGQFGPLVKRLRHHPFTVVTGVRFPQGSPYIRSHSSAGRAPALQAGGHRFDPCCDHHKTFNGSVAQLVRVPACHAGGRGFEPLLSRHMLVWLNWQSS